MARFTQNIEAILKEQQDNKERVECWIKELRLRWLRSLLFSINGILHQYDQNLNIKNTITLKEYDCATITIREYDEINGIEHIRALALHKIGLRNDADSWARLEDSPKVKIAFDGIVEAMNNYFEKYDPPYQCANKINELIHQIGWGQIENWQRLDLRRAKNRQRKLTDIKSLLSKNAEIEITTTKGKFSKISVRKGTTRTIDSPVVIGWFTKSVEESKYKDRFFDNTRGEDSRLIFYSGEVFDFLTKTLQSTVADFGAGEGQRIGTTKEMVTKLTPLYRHLKSLSVQDADVQIIRLFRLDDVLESNDFTTYIEKSAKIKS